MSADEPATAAEMPEKIAKALGRYRIAAYIVGVALLLLVVAMVLRYGFDQRWAVAVWGPVHGAFYAGYALLAFDLGYKDRWSPVGIVLVLLGGMVPVLSFYVERVVHRKVLARQRL